MTNILPSCHDCRLADEYINYELAKKFSGDRWIGDILCVAYNMKRLAWTNYSEDEHPEEVIDYYEDVYKDEGGYDYFLKIKKHVLSMGVKILKEDDGTLIWYRKNHGDAAKILAEGYSGDINVSFLLGYSKKSIISYSIKNDIDQLDLKSGENAKYDKWMKKGSEYDYYANEYDKVEKYFKSKNILPFSSAETKKCTTKKETIDFEGEKYTLVKKIGEGKHGQVWMAVSNGKKIAVKKIQLIDETRQRQQTQFWGDSNQYINIPRFMFDREIYLEKKINKKGCPSIIKYLGVVKGSGNVRYILMEYFRGYTLSEFQKCSEETGFMINPDQLLTLIIHLLKGLVCLHELEISHGDVKADNIMFNKDQMKFIDLGLLCTMSSSEKKDYNCYESIIYSWYQQDKRKYGAIKKDDYPYRADLFRLVNGLLNVINWGEFAEKYHEDDERIQKIDKWTANILNEPMRRPYTSKQALEDLEKIHVKPQNLY